jgi:hypothetical protein
MKTVVHCLRIFYIPSTAEKAETKTGGILFFSMFYFLEKECMRSIFVIVLMSCQTWAFGAENSPVKGSSNPSETSAVVFYVDGAGGGSLFTNWATGVRKGLKNAGVQGEFREFHWQTGLGVLADQTASVSYKRSKGKVLAEQIVVCKTANPERPVILIGLSAGTAIIIYALEALPETSHVDRVILLGSSMNARHNMTQALTRVEKDLIVYTSERDEILTVFVPTLGSADRQYVGKDVVGLQGFHMPVGADEMTINLYGKIKTIAWNQKFEAVGDYGRHVDKTNPEFVEKYLAPLVITAEGSSVLAMAQ